MKDINRILDLFIYASLGVLTAMMLVGCSRTIYVPVETVKTEYADKFLRDSIYLKDSIYIRERGDTVFQDRWHTKYIERLRVDSFCRIDSFPQPYPVEVKVEVEKKLTRWQKLKQEAGGIAIGGLLGLIAYLVIRRRFR